MKTIQLVTIAALLSVPGFAFAQGRGPTPPSAKAPEAPAGKPVLIQFGRGPDGKFWAGPKAPATQPVKAPVAAGTKPVLIQFGRGPDGKFWAGPNPPAAAPRTDKGTP